MEENKTALVETFPISYIANPHENPTVNPKDGNMKVVGVPVAVIPDWAQMIDLKPFFDKYRTKPETRKGNIILVEQQSFVDVVNRFKNPMESVIFIQAASGDTVFKFRMVCIFNWHPSGEKITDTGAADFRAEFSNSSITGESIAFIRKETALPIFYGEIP